MSRFCHWKLECMHWLKNCKLCSCICQLNKQDTVIRIRRKKVTDTIVVVTSQRPRNWTNVIEWKWVAHSNSNRWSHFTLTLMCPFSFFISPRQAEMREDLPQPTVPTTATRDPCFTLMLMLEQRNTHSYWCWNSATNTHLEAGTAQHTHGDAGTAQHSLILWLVQCNTHSCQCWNSATLSYWWWNSTTHR